ncbi:MAG TPA: hypothetical protein VF719_02985 [Abditibacteriaceae bacterium]
MSTANGDTATAQGNKPTALEYGRISEGLQLWARAEKEETTVGQPVMVILTLKNTGVKPVSWGETSPARDFDVQAADKSSQSVLPTAYATSRLTMPIFGRVFRMLQTGHQVTYKLPVNRLIDMTEGGTYSLVIKFPIAHESVEITPVNGPIPQNKMFKLDHTAPPVFKGVTSNILRIKVTEPNTIPAVFETIVPR